MKQFIAFVKKEFHHILRDRRTMLILIGMPIVQIILFGFAISTEVRNVQTAILSSSVNPDTRHIVDRLDASEYFTVKYIVHTNEELNQLFRKGKIELGIAFPRDLHPRQLCQRNNCRGRNGTPASGNSAPLDSHALQTTLQPADAKCL